MYHHSRAKRVRAAVTIVAAGALAAGALAGPALAASGTADQDLTIRKAGGGSGEMRKAGGGSAEMRKAGGDSGIIAVLKARGGTSDVPPSGDIIAI